MMKSSSIRLVSKSIKLLINPSLTYKMLSKNCFFSPLPIRLAPLAPVGACNSCQRITWREKFSECQQAWILNVLFLAEWNLNWNPHSHSTLYLAILPLGETSAGFECEPFSMRVVMPLNHSRQYLVEMNCLRPWVRGNWIVLDHSHCTQRNEKIC